MMSTYEPEWERETPKANGDGRNPPRIILTRFDKIELKESAEYVIKGLIPANGLTAVRGPPKSLKSYLVLDALLHVAWLAIPRPAVNKSAVVYCAFAGQRGVK